MLVHGGFWRPRVRPIDLEEPFAHLPRRARLPVSGTWSTAQPASPGRPRSARCRGWPTTTCSSRSLPVARHHPDRRRRSLGRWPPRHVARLAPPPTARGARLQPPDASAGIGRSTSGSGCAGRRGPRTTWSQRGRPTRRRHPRRDARAIRHRRPDAPAPDRRRSVPIQSRERIVPLPQARTYAEAARAAGDHSTLERVSGDHAHLRPGKRGPHATSTVQEPHLINPGRVWRLPRDGWCRSPAARRRAPRRASRSPTATPDRGAIR